MKNWMLVLATIGLVLYTPAAVAAAQPTVQRTTLGVPSYAGWTVHRLDDRVDSSGKTHLYQYQYYSDDAGPQIVEFYERRLSTTASFMEPTSTHTINSPDGAIVQITAPPDGVPDVGDDGQPTGKTWKSLITIIRFQAR